MSFLRSYLLYRLNLCTYAQSRQKTSYLDYSRFPKLNETEIEETFVRGSGPGGQSVNKTSNCVMLRHIPTNIVVKCHIHRSVTQNQKEARKILLNKLDLLYNGDLSIESQMKALGKKKLLEKVRRQKKLQEIKKKWLEVEGKAKDD